MVGGESSPSSIWIGQVVKDVLNRTGIQVEWDLGRARDQSGTPFGATLSIPGGPIIPAGEIAHHRGAYIRAVREIYRHVLEDPPEPQAIEKLRIRVPWRIREGQGPLAQAAWAVMGFIRKVLRDGKLGIVPAGLDLCWLDRLASRAQWWLREGWPGAPGGKAAQVVQQVRDSVRGTLGTAAQAANTLMARAECIREAEQALTSLARPRRRLLLPARMAVIQAMQRRGQVRWNAAECRYELTEIGSQGARRLLGGADRRADQRLVVLPPGVSPGAPDLAAGELPVPGGRSRGALADGPGQDAARLAGNAQEEPTSGVVRRSNPCEPAGLDEAVGGNGSDGGSGTPSGLGSSGLGHSIGGTWLPSSGPAAVEHGPAPVRSHRELGVFAGQPEVPGGPAGTSSGSEGKRAPDNQDQGPAAKGSGSAHGELEDENDEGAGGPDLFPGDAAGGSRGGPGWKDDLGTGPVLGASQEPGAGELDPGGIGHGLPSGSASPRGRESGAHPQAMGARGTSGAEGISQGQDSPGSHRGAAQPGAACEQQRGGQGYPLQHGVPGLPKRHGTAVSLPWKHPLLGGRAQSLMARMERHACLQQRTGPVPPSMPTRPDKNAQTNSLPTTTAGNTHQPCIPSKDKGIQRKVGRR